MLSLECNTTTAKKHVSKAEHMIHTIKEWTRGLISTLPYENIPCQSKIEFMYFCFCILWLNSFLLQNGIPVLQSPMEFLLCWQMDYKNIPTCCQAHIVRYMTNCCCPIPWLCPPTRPWQSARQKISRAASIFCSNTGHILKWCLFTSMLMLYGEIKCINAIGAGEKQG